MVTVSCNQLRVRSECHHVLCWWGKGCHSWFVCVLFDWVTVTHLWIKGWESEGLSDRLGEIKIYPSVSTTSTLIQVTVTFQQTPVALCVVRGGAGPLWGCKQLPKTDRHVRQSLNQTASWRSVMTLSGPAASSLCSRSPRSVSDAHCCINTNMCSTSSVWRNSGWET